jgi:hypothetical protein
MLMLKKANRLHTRTFSEAKLMFFRTEGRSSRFTDVLEFVENTFDLSSKIQLDLSHVFQTKRKVHKRF